MVDDGGVCYVGVISFHYSDKAFACTHSNLCTKTNGCGGYSINIMGLRKTLKVTKGQELLKSYQAFLRDTEQPNRACPLANN